MLGSNRTAQGGDTARMKESREENPGGGPLWAVYLVYEGYSDEEVRIRYPGEFKTWAIKRSHRVNSSSFTMHPKSSLCVLGATAS